MSAMARILVGGVPTFMVIRYSKALGMTSDWNDVDGCDEAAEVEAVLAMRR